MAGGKYAFVMMIQSRWWNEFRFHQSGQMQTYVQKGLAPPKKASLILFYVTKPVGEIAGYAEFVERRTGDAERLWKEYGRESVLYPKQKYEELVGDKKEVSFIRFKNLHIATKPIPLSNILLFLGVKRLARKGFYLDKETAEELIAQMECSS
jgi:predicted transcriptional regulator